MEEMSDNGSISNVEVVHKDAGREQIEDDQQIEKLF